VARRAAAAPRAVPLTVPPLDLRDAARDAAAHIGFQRQLLRFPRARTRARAVRRSGGIAVAAVRRSRLPFTNGRTGLLAIFRIRSAAPAGLAPSEDLAAVFAEGPCPRILRRRLVRARALAAMAALVPRMAASIPPPPAQPAVDPTVFDRDARLEARLLTRRAVQRGLFDRRAVREAEEAEADAVSTGVGAGARHETGGVSGIDAGHAPQPVLLLFVTS
jgi:hypothetical protein